MNPGKTRWLLWSGCLGAVVLFAGDMYYYGQWGSARGLSDDVWNSIMAGVPIWRHHLGILDRPYRRGILPAWLVGSWVMLPAGCASAGSPHAGFPLCV